MQAGLITILLQPRIEVASNTPMTKSICTVGCNIDLYEPVTLQMIIFCCRLTYRSILWQYDDAVVRGTYTNLIFGTNHAQTLHATQLTSLDGKALIAIVKHAT